MFAGSWLQIFASSWFRFFAGSWFQMLAGSWLPEIDSRFTRRSQIWLLFSHITRKLISWTSTNPTFRGCKVFSWIPQQPSTRSMGSRTGPSRSKMSVPARSLCCTTLNVSLENSPHRWSKTTRYLKKNVALIELLRAESNISRNRRRKKMIFFLFCWHVGLRCYRDGNESRSIPNIFGDLRSAVELLHGGDLWICSSRAIFQSWSSPKHYVKTSNRSRNICNRPLTPVTCTHICNGCYLVPVKDKRDRSTPGLASATPVTNVDFW
jgi:hypothetical protein